MRAGPPVRAGSHRVRLRAARPLEAGHRVGLLTLLACVPIATWAQDGVLMTRVDGSLNQIETRRANGDSSSELVAQLRPGLQYSNRVGRIRGSLSYAADLLYRSGGENGELHHNLSAAFTADVIENRAAIDASASVARRSVSPFGRQSAPGSLQENDNNQDVAQAAIRPHVFGRLGEFAVYDLSAFVSAVNTRHSIIGDSTNSGGAFSLRSQGGAIFGGGVHLSRQSTDFRAGRKTDSDRVIVDLTWRPDVDWLFTLRGGQERNDVASLTPRTYDNWGVGMRWTPSTRTLLSIDSDDRYFGKSWRVAIEHRLPRSVLRFASVRDASTSSSPDGIGQPTTVYQLFFTLLSSAFPDPVERDIQVRNLLASQGLDPNAIVPGGYASNAVSLQRRSDLAWTYTTARSSLTLQAFSSQSSVLDTLAPQPEQGEVRQSGYTVTLAHRLTPTAALNISGSRVITASNATQQGNDMKSLAVYLSEQLGARTTAALTLRYSVFNGVDAYREAAIGANLGYRF